MPVTCANCGAQNPDGNAFCMNCGQPLAGDAATPMAPQPSAGQPPAGAMPPGGPVEAPAAGSPPPAAPPAGAQYPPQQYAVPPYGTPPGGPTPPVHRLPVLTIVGATIGAVIILALVAVVVHAATSKTDPTPVPPPIPTATTVPTSLPVPTPTAAGGGAGPIPSPTIPATTVPTTAPSGSGSFSTQTFSIGNLNGFSVRKQATDSVSLTDPNGAGLMFVNAFKLQKVLTLQQAIEAITANVRKDAPDATDCGNGTSKAQFGNPPVTGGNFVLCYTSNSQNGPQTRIADQFLLAVSSTGDALFGVEMLGPIDKNKALVDDASPAIQTINWKIST